jgi:Domain of unknown function (DUF6919)
VTLVNPTDIAGDDRPYRTDRPEDWSEASTIKELGELTARWLTGTPPARHPSLGSETKRKTLPLAPVLAALNRAGYLTVDAQPGAAYGERGQYGYRNVWWQQRAAVQGFASGATLSRLSHVIDQHPDLLLLVNKPRGRWRRRAGKPPVPVTTRVGPAFVRSVACPGRRETIHTRYGDALRRTDIGWLYRGCRREAINAVCQVWQVTLVDLCWGRDDLLWPVLLEALHLPIAGYPAPLHPIVQYVNLVGAQVQVTANRHGSVAAWWCAGCGNDGEFTADNWGSAVDQALIRANDHAHACRALPQPGQVSSPTNRTRPDQAGGER